MPNQLWRLSCIKYAANPKLLSSPLGEFCCGSASDQRVDLVTSLSDQSAPFCAPQFPIRFPRLTRLSLTALKSRRAQPEFGVQKLPNAANCENALFAVPPCSSPFLLIFSYAPFTGRRSVGLGLNTKARWNEISPHVSAKCSQNIVVFLVAQINVIIAQWNTSFSYLSFYCHCRVFSRLCEHSTTQKVVLISVSSRAKQVSYGFQAVFLSVFSKHTTAS